MSQDAPSSSETKSEGGAFSSTQWSVVLNAHSSSAVRREALEKLCSLYWLPIYGYLRRRGNSAADAEDLTQGFFAYLIESDFLDRPDPSKGRFRGYLVGALRHFLGSHFEKENAIKRGGGARFIDWTSLDAEREYAAVNPRQQDPSEYYEASWAMALLARALERLEGEQAAAGRARQLAVLKPFLSTTPTPGDYDWAARELGATRTTVAVWVHRLTHRYGELVKLEVAATVQDPAEVKNEMQHLLRTLRTRGE
jgi:RNA polymerase sigma-70 factor (ECF subfamily)